MKLILLVTALVLMLAAMPLLSFGTAGGNDAVWIVGLALLAAGGAIPPVMRYAPVSDEDEDDSD